MEILEQQVTQLDFGEITSKIKWRPGDMRNEITKKILVDLFARPFILLPVVGGLTAVIFSWMVGSAVLAIAGVASVLAGLGIFATRAIFGLDKMAKKAQEQYLQQIEEEKNETLDELERRLKQDRDPRPEKCLRDLRALHELLTEAQKSNNTWVGQVKDDFDRLFEICVKQIEKTDQLWRASRKMRGMTKKKFKQEREKIVEEIEKTTAHLATAIQHFQIVSTDGNNELAEARSELEQTIEISKRVGQRLANLDNKGYDPKDFE